MAENSFKDDKVVIDAETQEMLNKPVIDPEGFGPGEREFIEGVMRRVYAGEMNLFAPSTLINEEIYEAASDEVQGQADVNAINFCAKLRQIRDLMEISGGEQLFVEPSFQVRNLVESVMYQKQEFEKQYGDMFVI